MTKLQSTESTTNSGASQVSESAYEYCKDKPTVQGHVDLELANQTILHTAMLGIKSALSQSVHVFGELSTFTIGVLASLILYILHILNFIVLFVQNATATLRHVAFEKAAGTHKKALAELRSTFDDTTNSNTFCGSL